MASADGDDVDDGWCAVAWARHIGSITHPSGNFPWIFCQNLVRNKFSVIVKSGAHWMWWWVSAKAKHIWIINHRCSPGQFQHNTRVLIFPSSRSVRTLILCQSFGCRLFSWSIRTNVRLLPYHRSAPASSAVDGRRRRSARRSVSAGFLGNLQFCINTTRCNLPNRANTSDYTIYMYRKIGSCCEKVTDANIRNSEFSRSLRIYNWTETECLCTDSTEICANMTWHNIYMVSKINANKVKWRDYIYIHKIKNINYIFRLLLCEWEILHSKLYDFQGIFIFP